MQIDSYKHSNWLTNTYLISEGSDAILIDAGGPVGAFDRINEGIKPAAIFLTHHHIDHVDCLAEWIERFDTPVYCHEAEAAFLDANCTPLADDSKLAFGDLSVELLHTPGHTAGHATYLVNNEHLFSGDLLFRESIGGTIAPGHTTLSDLKTSIMERVFSLPHETRLYPGHSESSTLAHEWEHNPFILCWRGEQEIKSKPCSVRDQSAELLLMGRDYDGGGKAWIRYGDGGEAIVPGSWVT